MAAVALAALLAETADWDLAALLILLGLALSADLASTQIIESHVRISGSFIVIAVAIIVLGPVPAALIGVATILAGLRKSTASHYEQLVNLATYAWFPLIAGIAFEQATDAFGVGPSDLGFYLLGVGAFAIALAVNFTLIAASACYLDGSSFMVKVRRALLPILPSELASALLAVIIAYLYWREGLVVLPLVGIALITFQYLLGALLVSRRRGDELELRAKQLAGAQFGLMSALLKTLDLRDRMTARHSAAVARYASEVARAAGLSEREQDLAHTAGLLHDIGKFTFPDRLLSGERELTEEDWDIIRTHPEQGARIVAEVDHYRPIADVIRAHHERIDGCGYPSGLAGDEIPILSRIISIVDTYDVMTARDSYRTAVSPDKAIEELRRVSGTQLDAHLVDVFIALLESKGLDYRHGEDADFDAELALERRVHDFVYEPEPNPRLVGAGSG